MDLEAQMQSIAEQAWNDSQLHEIVESTPQLSGIATMLASLYVEAYKRGATDTIVTLRAMQALDVSGKTV